VFDVRRERWVGVEGIFSQSFAETGFSLGEDD
jgi:hypothetical protein